MLKHSPFSLRIIGISYGLSLAGVLFALYVALARPFTGLSFTGHVVMASLIAALTMWMFRPGSGSFMVGVVIILLGGSLAGLPLADLASGYVSSSFWLLVSAMLFGYSLLKTGLGKRLILALFMHLKLTYINMLVVWFMAGLLFSLLTPSIMVRFLILTPIAVNVADACGLPRGDNGRSLIVISAWAVSIFPGLAWLNGSLCGPVFTGFVPAGALRDLAAADWLKAMSLPWLLFTIVFLLALYLALKPERALTISKAQLNSMYKDLGPMGKDERNCLFTTIFMLVGLVLQNFLPYTTVQVLFATVALLLFLGVLTVKDVSLGIGWDTVLFFGIILGFAHLLESSGISAWLAPGLSSFLFPIAVSPLLYLLALYVCCFLLRFLDVSQGWIVSAILALGTPVLQADFGLHPMVSLMVFVAAGNLFFFRYQQPWVGQAEAVIGEDGWSTRHLRTASFIYAVLSVLLLIFCRFYWPLVGIL